MSIQKKINIAVIGATGYTGLDLVLILSKHPKVKIKYLCATKNLGKNINFFDKRIKKKLPKISSVKKINWKSLDLVFLSLPNGEAQKLINKIFLINKNLKFIDLSADFRIKNPINYLKYYKQEHMGRVLEIMHKRMSGTRAENTDFFVREFYRDVPPDDVLAEEPENLYGAALSLAS